MSNYNGPVTPSKDAIAIQLENVDGQAGSNANINALATASAGSQSHKACVSSAGYSAAFPVKQAQASNIGGVGTNLSNPA